MNIMMVRDTLVNGDALTYQISLTYLNSLKQKSYGMTIILPLFERWVKGQYQMNDMMVRNTPSYVYTPTYQISLTYL